MRDDARGDVSDGEARSLIDRFPAAASIARTALFMQDFLTRHVDRLQIQMRAFSNVIGVFDPHPGMNKMSVNSPSLPMLVLMTPCALPR